MYKEQVNTFLFLYSRQPIGSRFKMAVFSFELIYDIAENWKYFSLSLHIQHMK